VTQLKKSSKVAEKRNIPRLSTLWWLWFKRKKKILFFPFFEFSLSAPLLIFILQLYVLVFIEHLLYTRPHLSSLPRSKAIEGTGVQMQRLPRSKHPGRWRSLSFFLSLSLSLSLFLHTLPLQDRVAPKVNLRVLHRRGNVCAEPGWGPSPSPALSEQGQDFSRTLSP
jgi:hypothetical protein